MEYIIKKEKDIYHQIKKLMHEVKISDGYMISLLINAKLGQYLQNRENVKLVTIPTEIKSGCIYHLFDMNVNKLIVPIFVDPLLSCSDEKIRVITYMPT